jgi:hypothetical protein
MKQIIILFSCLLLQVSCKINKQNRSTETTTTETSANNQLIKDCPEELIKNQMPIIGKSYKSNQYYIYKGIRKEIKEFDSVWVSKNCKVKTTVVN